MNKEENDIRYFTNLIEDNKTHKYDYRKYYTPIFDKRLENILNLISKLQKENDTLKTTINKQSKDISEQLKELDKKDKVIDLIITDYLNLSKERMSKEEFKKWYFDLVGIKKVEE